MRRRRGDGLVGCGRDAPSVVEVVLAGARDAPATATGPGGWWRRMRVRVRLRGRVREAGCAVAIELQGGGCGGGCSGGVAAADLRREVTVVVSGIDGLARRGSRSSRRLVLGVQRVHEVRAHRGGPGRAGGRSRRGARLGAAALPQGPLGRPLAPLGPPARTRVASEARQPWALSYWALMPGFQDRRLGFAPPPSRVAGPHPAPALRSASPGARLLGNMIAGARGDLPRCLHCFLSGTRPFGAHGSKKKSAPSPRDTLWLQFTNPRSKGKRKKTPLTRHHLSPRHPPGPLPTLSPPPPRLLPRCAPARHFRTTPLRGEGAR